MTWWLSLVKPVLDLTNWFLGRKSKLRTRPPRKPRPHTYRAILIVEDNPPDRDLLLICLRHNHLNAEVVDNAEGALALIRSYPAVYTVVFVDLRLTYMPGWDLIPIIAREAPNTLIVVVAGLLADFLNVRVLTTPVVLIEKPVSVEKIASLVTKLRI